jgi:nucleolar MIF4G domain-containing protein 1
MSATDAEHGFQQFLALGLNARQRRELSRVLVQCAASEGTYNPYYALVAKQACSNSAAIRFSFQDQLWGVFKRLGEPIFGDDSTNGDRDDLDSEMMADERTLKNVGTFFGALIFDSSLPITVLKPLDLHNIRGLTRFLIERVLITILRACTKISPRKRSAKVEKIFSLAREPVTLATGVHFLLELEHRKAMDGNSGSKFRETLVAAQETLLGNNSC